MSISITVTSVFVDDQAKALDFYTNTLGFVKKTDVPAGEHRWLTVVGAGAQDGVELLLEPDDHPAAKAYMAALVEDGIPATSFGVDDAQAEFERLSALGVRFTQPPMDAGPVTTTVLDDTCGNLIMLASMNPPSGDRQGEHPEATLKPMTEWWYNNKTGEIEEGPQSLGIDRDGPFATKEEAQRAPEIIAERSRKWAAEERGES